MGIPAQIACWDRWLERGHKENNESLRFRCDPEAPIQKHLGELLVRQGTPHCHVLDVGAGPLTSIGKLWNGLLIDVTAVDPLAGQYRILLSKAGVTPPVRTIEGHAEDLAQQFQSDYFHLICSDNSLDHCIDPLKALEAMLKILVPGGYICLQHYINEGKEEGYDGFHQWNFFEENGQFWIANEKGARYCVNDRFKGRAEVSCEPVQMLNREWIRVTVRKNT